MRKKVVLQLKGLDCANCAMKIQKKISDFDAVHTAVVDFPTQKLTFELKDEKDEQAVLKDAESIIRELEPGVAVKQANESHEHSHVSQKGTIIRLVVGAVLLATAIFLSSPAWLQIAVFVLSYLIIGGDILYKAVRNIFRGQVFDENFLMSLATIGAFAIGEYTEGAAVMLFYQVGELFQSYAVNRSRKSISDAMDIRPEYANLKSDDTIKKVNPSEVQINDLIVVKPGERVPLDGVVTEGSSALDTSALTGESVPREVCPGDPVLSGSINTGGLLTVSVRKAYQDSTVAKILNLVENVSGKKAKTENFITKFARVYTPIVVICALLLAVVPPLFGASFADWLYRALIFLVISCPCALVLSVPLSFFAGLGGAAKSGVLIKGGNYLEVLAKTGTVVFDKTGTLTKGTFKVRKIMPEGMSEQELLEMAAYAESGSNHPISKSIAECYGKQIDSTLIERYQEIPGHGIEAVIGGKTILAGNSKLMSGRSIKFTPVDTEGTIVYLAVNGMYAGCIQIADEVKKDSREAIQALKEIGIRKTVMLTGDNKTAGETVAKELGMDQVYTELLPDGKVEKVESLLKELPENKTLAFVGDGINDAPVLALSDVGIAMGGVGSDAAVEAADIVIMTDEPSKIPAAVKICRRTLAIVKQNIVFALGIKFAVLLLGAFGFATMWEAVFADVGVAVIAVLNAIRALRTH
mgnify:FL=1